MENIKEAFQRVKEDISSLKNEISSLRMSLVENREKMIEMCEILEKVANKVSFLNENHKKHTSTHELEYSTTSTHPSTHNSLLEGLKPNNLGISIGNEGVPTDRQTNRQTNRQTEFPLKILEKEEANPIENTSLSTIDTAAEILKSLDSIKKEIRLKFKRLTEQEMAVFSMLYQLDEEQGFADYRILAEKLHLTESSIRDYIGRIIKKGVPVEKKKVYNKNIHLSISDNLKKIASLSTILQLRGL